MDYDQIRHTLDHNVRILRTKVSKHALYGLLISTGAILVATVMVSYTQYGEITLNSMINSQRNNPAIWILDLSPFLFAFWGQTVSSMVCYEAGAMVVDQTNELRLQTNVLESQISFDAMHDSLTGLPNRILLLDRLTQALTNARNEKKSLALLIININNFKEVNDALGRHNGDRLLKQIATRLNSATPEPNTLARLNSDEFAILLPHIGKVGNATFFANKIEKALAIPFVLEEINLDIHAAIGIAVFPEHGTDPDTLLQHADVAMYTSKKHNKAFTVYSNKLDKDNPQRLILMGELRRAIKNNDLVLHYQPKVDLKTGHTKSVEALVRWNHPGFGLMMPDKFVPLAERTGLIKQLTQWVLNRAFKDLAEWQRFGININVSVNLSTVDILDIELPEIIAGLIAAYDLKPNWIILELTESAIMNDQQTCLDILNRLSSMGIIISIDDFGTGYSSLAYLSKLPVDEVKIDKSFVMPMNERREDALIVRSIIDLAHNLGLKAVAEGVCNDKVYKRLVDMDCDIGQGFYISKPIPHDTFIHWLSSEKDNNTEHQQFRNQHQFGSKNGDDFFDGIESL